MNRLGFFVIAKHELINEKSVLIYRKFFSED